MMASFAKKLNQATKATTNKTSVVLSADEIQPDAFDYDNNFNKNRVLELDCKDIRRNPLQPRKIFDEIEIVNLYNSIIEIGQLQPIIVMHDQLDSSKYNILIGERRWRAISLDKNGLKIKAIVIDSLQDLFKTRLIQTAENDERVNLTPAENAENYLELVKEGEKLGFNIKQIADMLQISRTKLQKYLSIAKSENLINFINNNALTGDVESLYLLSTIDKENNDSGRSNIFEDETFTKKIKNSNEPLRKVITEFKKTISTNDNKKSITKPTTENSIKPIKELDINFLDNSIVLSIDKKQYLLTDEQMKMIKEFIKSH